MDFEDQKITVHKLHGFGRPRCQTPIPIARICWEVEDVILHQLRELVDNEYTPDYNCKRQALTTIENVGREEKVSRYLIIVWLICHKFDIVMFHTPVDRS